MAITDILPWTVSLKHDINLVFDRSVEIHFSKSLGLISGTIFNDLSQFLRLISRQFDPDWIRMVQGTWKIEAWGVGGRGGGR